MKAKVSLVRSRNSSQGTLTALKLLEGQLKPLIVKAQNPVIKVNFVTVYRHLAATPVEAVKAVIEFLRQFLSVKILVAEEASVGATQEGWENYGYYQLEKDYSNVELFDLGKDETFPLEILNSHGEPFKVPFSATLRNSDFLISLTRPKTHDAVVVTLTGKNVAVGGIVGGITERQKIHQEKMIHQNLLLALEKVAPHLAILDGTQGMEGQGPSHGEAVKTNWAAASLDWLALDTLGAYLMGFDLKDIGYLYLAGKKGLGKVYPEEVKVIGEDPKLLQKKFKPHPAYSSQIQWR